MNKILISWEAYNNDYIKNEEGFTLPNPNGTHGDFYNVSFDYDTHYLLSTSSKENTRFEVLCNFLRRKSQKTICPTYLGINDVISIEELLRKLRPFLLKFREENVDIFISPGTPSMQTTWYLLAHEFPNLNLFQIRPPFKRNNSPVERIYLTVNSEKTSNALGVREKLQNAPIKDKDIKKTPSVQKIYDLADTIANPYKITTLILGKSGTGKEWIAKHIHEKSSRKKFLAVNCASLSDELLQSTLFGHVEGAFSGAVKETKGAFEIVNNGTLFLDEIGDISKKLQQSLLRVLQEGVIYRLGDFEKKIKIDVRIIAATNKNLFQMTEEGSFRSDLYYRLAIADIETIPFDELPISERKEYIDFFINKWKRIFKRRKSITFSKEAKQIIDFYPFPGNFRELDNLIQRFYTYVSDNGIVSKEMIPKRIQFPQGTKASLKIEDIKNTHYRKVYKMYQGNQTKMMKALGIGSLNTVKSIITKLKKKELI